MYPSKKNDESLHISYPYENIVNRYDFQQWIKLIYTHNIPKS